MGFEVLPSEQEQTRLSKYLHQTQPTPKQTRLSLKTERPRPTTFPTKKAHQRSNEKRKKAGFEPGSHDFFFLRRFAISSSATGSKFVVVVTRKLTSHACQAGRPWKRCTSWTSCDSFDRQLMPTNASDVWFVFKRGCFYSERGEQSRFVGHGRPSVGENHFFPSVVVVFVVGSHSGRLSRSQLGKYWGERRGKCCSEIPQLTFAHALARLTRTQTRSLSRSRIRAHTHTHSSPLPTRFLAAESRK